MLWQRCLLESPRRAATSHCSHAAGCEEPPLFPAVFSRTSPRHTRFSRRSSAGEGKLRLFRGAPDLYSGSRAQNRALDAPEALEKLTRGGLPSSRDKGWTRGRGREALEGGAGGGQRDQAAATAKPPSHISMHHSHATTLSHHRCMNANTQAGPDRTHNYEKEARHGREGFYITHS